MNTSTFAPLFLAGSLSLACISLSWNLPNHLQASTIASAPHTVIIHAKKLTQEEKLAYDVAAGQALQTVTIAAKRLTSEEKRAYDEQNALARRELKSGTKKPALLV